MLTQGDYTGDLSVVDRLKNWIKARENKPGNVFLGVLHRLDRPCSGVLLLAKRSKAARRLSEQIREHSVQKTYRTIVNGRLQSSSGEWVDYIGKNSTQKVSLSPTPLPGYQKAILQFEGIETNGDQHLLAVNLITGRKHQIRAQFGARGLPILGDKKYGSSASYTPGIALLCYRMEFYHPITCERHIITVPETLSPLARAHG